MAALPMSRQWSRPLLVGRQQFPLLPTGLLRRSQQSLVCNSTKTARSCQLGSGSPVHFRGLQGDGQRCRAARHLAAATSNPACGEGQKLSVERVINNLRSSIIPGTGDSGKELFVTGVGRHLGINVTWSMRWRPDGAFVEEIMGRELGFKWGFDGGAESSCWEMDSSGVSRSLECDDHEALLISAWVRTGAWLHPALTQRLDISILSEGQPVPQRQQQPLQAASSNSRRQSQAPGSTSGTSGKAVAPDASTPGSSSNGGVSGQHQGSSAAGQAASTSPGLRRKSRSPDGGGKAGSSPGAHSSTRGLGIRAGGVAPALAPPPPPIPRIGADPAPSSSSNGGISSRQISSGADSTALRRQSTMGSGSASSAPGSSLSIDGPASSSEAEQLESEECSTSGAEDESGSLGAPHTVQVAIRTRGGKMTSIAQVCTQTWVVQSLSQPLCGDVEVWSYGSWKEWQPGIAYPQDLVHEATAGGTHVYRATKCTVEREWSPLPHFQLPSSPLLPVDSTYDTSIPPSVPVWRASSGHLLVRPHINGQESGYVVLDTGASGFVITPRAAESLELEPFGELFASSIAGKVPAQFVKARTWSLGPLTISAPVMMTMPLDGLVKGGPPGGEVIGIVGYDIFRRAVIELPQMIRPSHATPLFPPANGSSSHHSPTQGTHLRTTINTTISDPDLNSEQQGALHTQQQSHARSEDQGAPTRATLHNSGPASFIQGFLGRTSSGVSSEDDSASQPREPLLNATLRTPSTSGSSSSGADSRTSSREVGELLTPSPESSSSSSIGDDVIAPNTNRNISGRDAGSQAVPSMQGQPSDSLSAFTTQPSASAESLRNLSSRNASGSSFQRSSSSTSSSSSGIQQYALLLHHPDLYGSSDYDNGSRSHGDQQGEITWHTFRMVSSLPHIEVRLQGASPDAPSSSSQSSPSSGPSRGTTHQRKAASALANAAAAAAAQAAAEAVASGAVQPVQAPVDVLLMLDTGACGTDIILHGRAMDEFGLWQYGRPSSQLVRGVGNLLTDASNVRVHAVDLAWAELAGIRFTKMRCMHAAVGGLDISLYSSGIICGDFLARLPAIIDYPRKRIGLRLPLPSQQQEHQ